MLIRTNIYLPENVLLMLKRKTEEQGISMAEFVRTAVEKELEKKKDELKDTGWAKSLLELAKRAPKPKSKISDLSKRHDYYLYIEPYERQQKRFLKEMRRRKK